MIPPFPLPGGGSDNEGAFFDSWPDAPVYRKVDMMRLGTSPKG